MSSNVGNNPKQTCSKDGIQAQNVRHLSSRQCTSTASGRGIWTLLFGNSNFDMYVCVYIYFSLGVYIHPTIQFFIKKTRCSLATPLWQLWFRVRSIFSNVGMIIFLFPHIFVHALDIKSCMKIPNPFRLHPTTRKGSFIYIIRKQYLLSKVI